MVNGASKSVRSRLAVEQGAGTLDHGLVHHAALESKSAFASRFGLLRGGNQTAGMIERFR
jgi:hypothetical protein